MPLTIGYLEIISDKELHVTAVYTASDPEGRGLSVDVVRCPASSPSCDWSIVVHPAPAWEIHGCRLLATQAEAPGPRMNIHNNARHTVQRKKGVR